MPEIPVIGFVIEAIGAAGLALTLHVFERQHSRPGVREWSFGLWALALGLLASIATVRLRFSTLNPGMVVMADIPYYWARGFLLLGTWARWRDKHPGRWPRLLLVAGLALPVLVGLAPLEPAWRPVVRAAVYSAVLSPATLATAVLLLRVRRDARRFGARVLALSFLGLTLEDLFLTGVLVADAMRFRHPLAPAAADHLIEGELLLLMFVGVGMVAWLLAEEREAAVRLEEKVRRKEAMSAMGALVAGVAHEVRNPLFGISSTLDVLEVRLGAQAAASSCLTALRGEVQRMSSLMNELLDYGRPVDPGLVTEPLGGVLEEALRACVPLALRAGVTIEASHDLPALPVAMDRPRLVQVFQNLIQNAIQHTPPGRAVRVEAWAEAWHSQRGVRCAVRDSGPGFAAGDLARIFEPFFTRRPGGTGLGLSIVQRIVQEHMGHVDAANHPGGGGVVGVWLPAVEGALRRPAPAA
ncbi:MAG TPA: ATP-binding protein [Vicinamibacteria bacterium]|nr:ATP-binding protein [Vicinamibacteria bacterium]